MKSIKKSFMLLLLIAVLVAPLIVPASADAKTKYVTVTVTDMLNSDGLQKYLGEMNFKKKVVNEKEYTTTYTMTQKQQKNILKFLRKEFNGKLVDEFPAYYLSMKINKSFTSIKLYVDKQKYLKAPDDDMTILGLMIVCGGYQQFAGVKDKDVNFKISVIDNKTKKVIKVFNDANK